MDLLATILLAAAVANLVLGLLVRLLGPDDKVSQTFSEMVFVVAAWVLANFFERLTHDPLSVRTCYAIPLFFPAVLLVFISAFVRSAGFQRRRFWPFYLASFVLALLAYTPLIVAQVIGATPIGIATAMGPLFPAYAVYLVAALSYCFWQLFQAYRQAAAPRRQQIQYMFVGLAVFAGTAVVLSLFLPLLGDFRFNELDSAASLFFIAFTAYAIVAHRLLNIEVVFSGTVLVIFWGGLIALINLLFLFFFQLISGISLGVRLYGASTVFLIAISFLFTSFRQRLTDIVDRVVYHDFYDYEMVVREAVDEMVTRFDLAELLNYLCQTIGQAMGVDKIQVYLSGLDKMAAEPVLVAGCAGLQDLSQAGKWVEALRRNREVLFLTGLLDQDLTDFLSVHQAEVFLPLVFADDFLGCFLLGAKRLGGYSDKDKELLATLARQAAVALANVRLVRQQEEDTRSMAAVKVQAQYAAELEDKNRRLEDAYRQLEKTQQELVRASKEAAASEIVLTLQHEINNPLTAILLEDWLGLQQIGQESGLPQDYYRQVLEKIQLQALRLKEVMHKLRQLEEPLEKDYLPGVKMIDLDLEPGTGA